ncbi:AI-2E family transporter [Caulobacter sp. S45]|uniref:AI-2E family transporter n=1 Tax=Caulobacter sp. S45 TaxID=1641861 RepID=UPI001575FF0A|nr:AI-2E family transporter [Caulobacter sp. S45]
MAEDEAKPGTWVRDAPTAMSRGQLTAGLIAAGLLLLAGLHTLGGFLPALVWAVVIAIAVWPLFHRLARRWPNHRRELLPGLVILAILLIFVIPLTLVAVPAATDAHSMAQWMQQVRTNGLPPPPFLQNLPEGQKLTDLWRSRIGEPGAISDLTTHAMQGGLLQFGRRFGAEALHRVVLLGFMLLALFFLLRDVDGVVDQLRVASRRTFGPAGEDVARQMILSIHGTVNGLVLVGLGEGVIIGIAYMIAGVPHATLFALFTAFLAMIPFGAAIAIAVAAVALLAVNKVIAAVVVVVFGLMVTFVADHFIRPVLIGGATKLPFVWVLFGILGGVEGWGLVGLFIGPAVLAALILLWREWVGSMRGPINPTSEEAQPVRDAPT